MSSAASAKGVTSVSPDPTPHPDNPPGPHSADVASAPVWHYVLDDQAFGPTDAAHLRQMFDRALLDHNSLLWREGWEQWQQLSQVAELAGLFPAPQRTTPAAQPPAPAPTFLITLRLFALRFAAAAIDQVILLIPSCLSLIPYLIEANRNGMTFSQIIALTPADRLWWLGIAPIWIVGWLYSASLESSPLRATLGKKLCGLSVTDLDGRRLSFARASARYWAKVLSSAFYAGYLLALVTGGHRALHDLLARTIIREQP